MSLYEPKALEVQTPPRYGNEGHPLLQAQASQVDQDKPGWYIRNPKARIVSSQVPD
jgi:hypothetical protein